MVKNLPPSQTYLNWKNKGPAKWLKYKATNTHSVLRDWGISSRWKDLSLLTNWVVLKRNLGYFPRFIKHAW